MNCIKQISKLNKHNCITMQSVFSETKPVAEGGQGWTWGNPPSQRKIFHPLRKFQISITLTHFYTSSSPSPWKLNPLKIYPPFSTSSGYRPVWDLVWFRGGGQRVSERLRVVWFFDSGKINSLGKSALDITLHVTHGKIWLLWLENGLEKRVLQCLMFINFKY